MTTQNREQIHPDPLSPLRVPSTAVPYFDGTLEEQTYFALNSLLVVERLLAAAKAIDLEPDELLGAEALLYRARTFLQRLDPVAVAIEQEREAGTMKHEVRRPTRPISISSETKTPHDETPQHPGKGKELGKEALAAVLGELQVMPAWEELEIMRRLTTRLLKGSLDPFQKILLAFVARPELRAGAVEIDEANTQNGYRYYRKAKANQERRNALYDEIRALAESKKVGEQKQALRKALALVKLNGPFELSEEEENRYLMAMVGIIGATAPPDSLWCRRRP
ncbi:MAG: hypothetical protein ACREJ6_10395 [Candidatus Methylomirabilis sp.]